METEIASLTERLQQLSDALVRKYEAREEFDRTISETEQAFMKILESSQTLLHVLKKEDTALNKRKLNVSTRRGGNKENHNSQSPMAAEPKPRALSKGKQAQYSSG